MGSILIIGAGLLAYAAYRKFTQKVPDEDSYPFTQWYTYGTRAKNLKMKLRKFFLWMRKQEREKQL